MRQVATLLEKVRCSKDLIRCWYEAWDGNVYVSFSGGRDSTVLLHLVRTMFPEVPGVFVNTGLEYPEIVALVESGRIDLATVVSGALPLAEINAGFDRLAAGEAVRQVIVFPD